MFRYTPMSKTMQIMMENKPPEAQTHVRRFRSLSLCGTSMTIKRHVTTIFINVVEIPKFYSTWISQWYLAISASDCTSLPFFLRRIETTPSSPAGASCPFRDTRARRRLKPRKCNEVQRKETMKSAQVGWNNIKHGDIMGISWEHHGNIMGRSWMDHRFETSQMIWGYGNGTWKLSVPTSCGHVSFVKL